MRLQSIPRVGFERWIHPFPRLSGNAHSRAVCSLVSSIMNDQTRRPCLTWAAYCPENVLFRYGNDVKHNHTQSQDTTLQVHMLARYISPLREKLNRGAQALTGRMGGARGALLRVEAVSMAEYSVPSPYLDHNNHQWAIGKIRSGLYSQSCYMACQAEQALRHPSRRSAHR